MMTDDERFMKEAIEQSEIAVRNGDEPFGAVLVKDNEVVFRNANQIYSQTDPTFHAEMGLMRRFCTETHITDLSDYTLYSSTEPCLMCSGAMVWTKLGTLVFGATNKDLSDLLGEPSCETAKTVFENSVHQPVVRSGVLRDEARAVLKQYFENR